MISSIKRKETILASANLPEGVVRTKLRSRTDDLVNMLIDRLMDGLACWERVRDDREIDTAMFTISLQIECDRVPEPEEAEDEEDEDG